MMVDLAGGMVRGLATFPATEKARRWFTVRASVLSARHAASDSILIVDFGSQVTQLIARRVREAGVYCEIAPFGAAGEVFERLKPKGIIFSGGPSSVMWQDSPRAPQHFFDIVPILAICYGQQTMARNWAASSQPPITASLAARLSRWWQKRAVRRPVADRREPSSVDEPWRPGRALPEGFSIVARSEGAPYAIATDEDRRFYSMMFHPEVVHTPDGGKLLANFARHICGCAGDWTMGAYRDAKIADIRAQVGKGKVICGLSGGVDSAVAAVLIHEAIGDQLTCVFVDHGLMRQGEAEQVVSLFRNSYNIPLVHVDAEELFCRACPASRTRRRSASSSARRSSTCSTRRRRRSAVRTSSLRARSIPT